MHGFGFRSRTRPASAPSVLHVCMWAVHPRMPIHTDHAAPAAKPVNGTIVATGQPILIAIALLLVILIGGGISGGHFNPAVSVMFYAKGALTSQDLLAYICAQVLGGLAALAAYLALVKPATPVVV